MPSIREVFDKVDKQVSETILRVVNTPEVAEALLVAGRLGRIGLGRVGDLRGGVVHVLSLPSHQDIQQLAHRMAALDGALAEVEAQIEELKAEPK
jgi:hypothetical protein